ncbi:RNA-directed DNA polymerase from mobile element jockey [Eumeta japonica]|uniref:RNA-directed DNA polymerase from mobile element jockey n=1 Tax=Eumeta variegata TaxID=151549 RepID=A0A4C2A7F1_EUMVA|nr:RNA-directed DNA polymerase from mobile element jockey [Eumeta japonica]
MCDSGVEARNVASAASPLLRQIGHCCRPCRRVRKFRARHCALCKRTLMSNEANDVVLTTSFALEQRFSTKGGRALDLLKSYLSNRVQRVDVNGKKSSGSIVHMGVPQGSILGPFLFLVYINDLPSLVKDAHEIVLFADDTSLLFKVKRQQPTYDDVNNAISKSDVVWYLALGTRGYSENFCVAEAGRSRNLQARTSYIP